MDIIFNLDEKCLIEIGGIKGIFKEFLFRYKREIDVNYIISRFISVLSIIRSNFIELGAPDYSILPKPKS